MTWDLTTPAGTDLLSSGDDKIRELKTDLQTALQATDATLGNEGVFPVNTTTPAYRYRGLKGTTAQRPAPGNYGLYWNTTTSTLQRDNGSAWEDVGIIPASVSGTVLTIGTFTEIDFLPTLVPSVNGGSDLGTTAKRWGALRLQTAIGSSTPDTNTLYRELIPKAWAICTSSGVVTSGININASAHPANGTYDYTFKTNMADANYVVVGNSSSTTPQFLTQNAAQRTSSGFRIVLWNLSGTNTDQEHYFTVFGKQ